ncbi:MAG TPA: cyclase family protein [Actinomycetota bacterium]
MAHIVDLTHPIGAGTITYPGLPAPELSDHLSREASRERYAPGTEFHIGRITMVGNTGTYLDTPFHRYPDGTDLATTPLGRMVELDGLVVDGTGRPSVGATLLEGRSVAGRAVLLRTDWSRNWGTDAYLAGHPFLTADGAAWLVDRGAALVGIDSLNIDSTDTGERPAHSALLAAGIPVVEHLCNLHALPVEGFRFSAAPTPVAGLGTFPVRAYGVLDG